MKEITNHYVVTMELRDAAEHLNELIKEVEAGHYDPNGECCYSTAIRHIYEHLNRSYHNCDKTDDEIDAISQKEFSRLSDTLPDFHSDMKLDT